ncbi:PQQ-dependent sugar dehydrogenase [Streptomyces tricolor]|nr:PQQ-dependent sugar dehydrogenase [Streptomyces tricolor]
MGTISRIDEKMGRTTELARTSGVSPAGEGGLLGFALPGLSASDRMVYAYFTSASTTASCACGTTVSGGRPRSGNRAPWTRCSRASLRAPCTTAAGSRLRPGRHAVRGTGERAGGPVAGQDASPGGKILRLTGVGNRTAKFVPRLAGVLVRPPQRPGPGLDDWQRLFAVEFGQDTWDELNAIRPGDTMAGPEAEGKSSGAGSRPAAQWRTDEASPAASRTWTA